MAKLPPLPPNVPPGGFQWNDWYEKLRTQLNSLLSGITWSSITGTPTTLAGYNITDAAPKNGSNRMSIGVDTTDDIIVDLATKGLVLKDTQGTPHYWRITVSTTGVLTTTDLGTGKP